MTAFGIMMRVLTGSFFSMTGNMDMVDPFFGGSSGSITWYDAAGNVIDTPYYAGEFMESIGISNGASTSFSSTASGPFNVISGFVIMLGVVTLIGGIAMAVLLKRWGEKTQ